MIEVATPRIFDLNQRLFNYAINNIVVPRINKILTMYSVILPSRKLEGGNKMDGTVYMRKLSDPTVIKYLKEHPIHFPDEQRVLNMLFDDKFYDVKARRKRAVPSDIKVHSKVAETKQTYYRHVFLSHFPSI